MSLKDNQRGHYTKIFTFSKLNFSFSENPEMQKLKEAIDEFKGAINSPDPEKMEVIWAEDAIFMHRGFEIIKGKKKVVEVWKGNIKTGFKKIKDFFQL